MKPVLQGITIQNLDLYKQVISKYHIKDTVVGSIFKDQKSEETIHFSDKNKLFYNPVSDEITIRNSLRNICNVYTRSSQVMHAYKDRYKNFD